MPSHVPPVSPVVQLSLRPSTVSSLLPCYTFFLFYGER